MLKGAIFDMDGTLLDSMYVWRDFDREYLRRHGIDTEEDLRDRIAPMTLPQAAVFFRERFGLPYTVEEIIDQVNSQVEEEYFYKVQPKPGIPEMVKAFYEAGVKMCIATATDRYLAEAALKRTGLLQYFSKIFTSTEIGSSKREPKTFQIALEYLGTPKDETYVFEDAAYAVMAAKSFGFHVVAIKDPHSSHHGPEIRETADILLDDISRWREKIELPPKT